MPKLPIKITNFDLTKPDNFETISRFLEEANLNQPHPIEPNDSCIVTLNSVGRVTGMLVSVVESDVHYRWISKIYVRPEWQGKGLGFALMYHILNNAKLQGATRIGLGTMHENKKMQRMAMHFCFERMTQDNLPDYEFRLGIKEYLEETALFERNI